MTLEEELKSKVKSLNESHGDLKHINCAICNDKGYIYYLDEVYIKTRKCECLKQRKVFQALEECGITKRMLEKCTVKNFIATEQWQVVLKDRVIKYIKEIQDNKKWLCISSISGSGKTHLCTAIFQHCIKLGMDCKFMLWKDDLPNIVNLKKSSSERNMVEYNRVMEQLKNIELLYIDDFLKLTNNYNKNTEMDIAYEIINARYNNGKKTIISTEYQRSALMELDVAITGRMVEMCKEYFIELKQEENRNYRMKELNNV